MYYTLKDHQGSLAATIHGNTVERLSYDAWGNLRNPVTWSGSFTGTPMFDRGFTGHEHLYNFGLINMNGRMYDPVTSSFLSVDQYVQSPENAQGFNRYAYCMNNPLRYVDPSGWLAGGGNTGYFPNTTNTFDPYMFYGGHIPLEPRDFRNAYDLFNNAFYGNTNGWVCSGGGVGFGESYYGSYGYYVTHYANCVYNYTFPSAQFQLIRNWHTNPSYTTNKELCEAGILNINAGEAYGSYQGEDGYRNSYYTWMDSNGKTHTATVLGEYVGGTRNGVNIVSNLPLNMYGARTPLEKTNIIIQSLGVPLGTIAEGMEIAAKSYHNVPVLKINSGLTQAQKIAAISKEGTTLLKASKGLGRICAVASVGISGYQTANYYIQGGKGSGVLLKGLGDVGMVAVGVFGGPIGLGISIGYFVLDLSTDGFGVSYEIEP